MNTPLTAATAGLRDAATVTLSRRLVLAGSLGGVAALATACSGGTIPLISPPDPDDEVRRTVAQSEQTLIAAYDAAITAMPVLGATLRPFRDQHQAHLTAVTADLELPDVAASGSPRAAGGGQAALIRELRRLEAGAVRQRIDACVAAEDAELAALFARIGASESGHVAALTGGMA